MVLWRVVVLGVSVRMSLCKLQWRSVKLCMLGVVVFWVPRICDHVLSPRIGRSAYVNVISGVFRPSTTPRVAASTSSLYVTPVCDLTLPMCVLYPILSRVRMMSSASCRSSLWGWWLTQRGSMAYLRMALMLKALSASIESVCSFSLASSASAMAASSARFMVCLSGWDFIFICVVAWALGRLWMPLGWGCL